MPTNIRLGWKGLPGQTLYLITKIKGVKVFIKLAPENDIFLRATTLGITTVSRMTRCIIGLSENLSMHVSQQMTFSIRIECRIYYFYAMLRVFMLNVIYAVSFCTQR